MRKYSYRIILVVLICIQAILVYRVIDTKYTINVLQEKLSAEKESLINLNKSIQEEKAVKGKFKKDISFSERKGEEYSKAYVKSKRGLEKEQENQLKTYEINNINKRIRFFEDNIPNEKIAYLTFDDGPSYNTLKILDILKKYNIQATFFVTGSETSFAKDVYKRIIKQNCVIGNHTFSHDYNVIYKDRDSFVNNFKHLENLIYNTTGVRPNIVRFPGGSNNTVSYNYGGKGLMGDLSSYLISNDYTYFDWNVSSTDAEVTLQKKENIINSVIRESRGKRAALILMHDSPAKKTTVEALPEVIEGLMAQGFKFKTLNSQEYTIQFLRAEY